MIEMIKSAYVIGRRDFTAIIFSKAFLFFLLGPMFPLLVGGAAGALGGEVARDIANPVVGVTMSAGDGRALMAARAALAEQMGERRFPELKLLGPGKDDAETLLKNTQNGLIAVLEGTLDKPKLVGTAGPIDAWKGESA